MNFYIIVDFIFFSIFIIISNLKSKMFCQLWNIYLKTEYFKLIVILFVGDLNIRRRRKEVDIYINDIAIWYEWMNQTSSCLYYI